MRWWGWGEDGGATPLSGEAERLLRDELGLEGVRRPPVALDEVRLPEPALPPAARDRLVAIVGAEHVRDDRLARVSHAHGKSYADLVRIRSGDGLSAPDAVVEPGSSAEVGQLLSACAAARVAVVPFGGGTSVVGGVEPERDGLAGAVSLDLRRLDRVLETDARSLLATVEPGLLGPKLEAELGARGLTLGHHPQSFEFSTVGGWVATRSAGQASSGIGRIDELVEGLRLCTPAGELRVPAVPASATGPSLRELVVGSEGVLGVITEVTLRVRPRPAATRYEGWSFGSFEQGVEALRALAQAGAAPDVARLSDEAETRLSLALAGGGPAERLGDAYLRARGRGEGCLAIVGVEGERDAVEERRRRIAALLRAGGALPLGRRPGAAWLRSRYSAPYLRDELVTRGALVETLETATSWGRLLPLHAAISDVLREALSADRPALVMCHVSHLYRSGAALYFTALARARPGAELEQWQAAKRAASDTIVAHGATITHHHAVGRDHLPWMAAELGPLGLELLRAVKARLDPAGVMNPGKLVP